MATGLGCGGARVPAVAGLLATGIFTWQLGSLDITIADITIMLITGLRGIGAGLALTPVTTFALAEVPKESTAQASTVNRVLFSVFGSMGAAILSSLLNSYENTNLLALAQRRTRE